MAKQINRRNKIVVAVVIVLATALLVYGFLGFWERYRITNNPNPTITTEVISVSTGAPDETPLDAVCDDYRVDQSRPRKITIDSVGVDACIQQVGLDQDSNIAVPTNIHLTGWYVDSAVPGGEGVSIIDGHEGGRYNDGVFKNLAQASRGDAIAIELGDGSEESFEVVDVNSYAVEDASLKMLEQLGDVSSQLTLITCGGNFDDSTQTYDERVIVRAKLINDNI